MFRGRRFIFLSALVVFVAITALSLMPPRTNLTIPTNDKVGHFIAYAVFSLNILLFGEEHHAIYGVNITYCDLWNID